MLRLRSPSRERFHARGRVKENGGDTMNGCGRSRFAPGLVAGIVLTALGSLFVLDSFGVLDAGNLLDYWPLFLILPGIAHMLWPRKHADRFWGAILVGIGTLLLLR